MVVRQGHTTRSALTQAMASLQPVAGKLAGAVLNAIREHDKQPEDAPTQPVEHVDPQPNDRETA